MAGFQRQPAPWDNWQPPTDPRTQEPDPASVPGFDAAFYTQDNPDVAASGINPLLHYLAFGQGEGRAKNASMPSGQTTPIPEAPIFDPTSSWDWGNFRQQAANSTAGINRMPFVFSDTRTVPMDAAASMARFYPEQAMREAMRRAGMVSAAPDVTNLGMGSGPNYLVNQFAGMSN